MSSSTANRQSPLDVGRESDVFSASRTGNEPARQERALVKRRALIDAGTKLFSEASYEATTAKTIAAEAGVATGTFYQNFDNKADLLRVIAKQRMLAIEASLTDFKLQLSDGQPAANLIKTRFLAVLQFIYAVHVEQPQLHRVLEQRRGMDLELEKILVDGQKALQERTAQIVHSFQIEPAETVAANLYAMAEGLVHALVFGQSHRGVSHEESLAVGAEMLSSFFEKSK